MTEEGASSAGASGHARQGISFGMHQALEYLFGIFLALNAVHLAPRAATLALGLGMGLLLLSLVSDGPLGGWRLVSPGLHRVGDFLIVALAATSPFLFHLPLDLSTLVLPVATALLLASLSSATVYWRPPPLPAPEKTIRNVAATTGGNGPPPPLPPLSRALGAVVGRVQSQGPRALGHAVGRMKRKHDQKEEA